MRRFAKAVALACALGLGLFVAVPFLLAFWAPQSPPLPRDVHGAYHVHSTLSDGRGSPSDIAHAAQKAGLSFVLLTDHNLGELPRPSFQEGVLLLWGTELSTPHGHLVALGLPHGLAEPARADHAVARVRALGGAGFLAHPVQRHWPWTAWDEAADAQGYELFSGDTWGRRALAAPLTLLLPALGAYLARPQHAVVGLVQEDAGAAQTLLSLAREHWPKVALCGLDAHGYPSYGEMFRALSMHLPGLPALPRDPEVAARTVLNALVQGQAYCAVDALGRADGFRMDPFLVESRQLPVGARLRLEIPENPRPTRVWVQGPAHVEGTEGRTVVLDGAGAVQVEVQALGEGPLLRRSWKPWIVPSPLLAVPPPPGGTP